MRAAAALACLTLWAAPARADAVDVIAQRLRALEARAAEIDRLVRPPAPPPRGDPKDIERRLVQAQVAYGLGRFAEASLILYDIVERYPESRAYPDALFYLADSLFQKGDDHVARDYYDKIVDDGGPGAPHYQQALERLLEISLRLKDSARVADTLARLDAIPTGKRSPSLPYVRGKYAYFSKDYGGALRWFDDIPADSPYALQARYFTGVTRIAQGRLDEAIEVYRGLVATRPRNANERKILELGELALGRLYYERERPAEAAAHYQRIDPQSPYHDEALYELAWVYVQARQFDKALAALERLAIADPKSARLPDVRILEGNLRVRLARTSDAQAGHAAQELARATAVFEETRAAYEGPRAALEKIRARHDDPRQFFAQIVRRADDALQVQVELPPVVVAWLEKEPPVQRAVGVASTLGEIHHDLDDTARVLVRLERAVSSPTRVALFPALAEKRGRAQEIGAAALAARQQLHTHELNLVLRRAAPAELAGLRRAQAARAQLARRLAALPGSGESTLTRVRKARAQYVELDKKAQEIEVLIISLEAQLTALDKYHADMTARGAHQLPAADYREQAGALRTQIAALRTQLDAIRNDIQLASDDAGVSAALAAEEDRVRGALQRALQAEHDAMQPIVLRMSGEERARAVRIAALADEASRIEENAAHIEARIDGYVDAQLAEARAVIAEEKERVADYQLLAARYDPESAAVGGEVVASAFDAVARKLYRIGVRADVGLLDVSWAEHEQAQRAVERLRVDYSRAKTTLEKELRSIDPESSKPAEPADAPP